VARRRERSIEADFPLHRGDPTQGKPATEGRKAARFATELMPNYPTGIPAAPSALE